MDKWLISPPVVFLLILLAMWVLSRLFSLISFRVKKHTSGEGQSYACGESNYNQLAQPDYSSFFSFAFFFTLAHVATLIITTIPAENARTLGLAFIYIAGAVIGLFILLRK